MMDDDWIETGKPDGPLDFAWLTRPRSTTTAHLVAVRPDGTRYGRTLCNVEVTDEWRPPRRDRKPFACNACSVRLEYAFGLIEWWAQSGKASDAAN